MRERVYTLIAWLVVIGALVWTLRWAYQEWSASQPVPFNHKKHVDFGIACETCHTGTRDAAKAGIPNVRTCGLCHVPGTPNPETPPALEQYISEMKEIPWHQVYQVPPHVRFSHQRHVRMAGLDCKVCHGEIGRTKRALTRQIIPLNMENCLDCHRREKVTTDCLACHR